MLVLNLQLSVRHTVACHTGWAATDCTKESGGNQFAVEDA